MNILNMSKSGTEHHLINIDDPPAYTTTDETLNAGTSAAVNTYCSSTPINADCELLPRVGDVSRLREQVLAYKMPRRVYDNYHSKQSHVVGISMMADGAVYIIINIISMRFETPFIGILAGLMFILTGAFAVAAARIKSKCMIVTLLVLSVQSAAMCIVVFVSLTIALNYSIHYYFDVRRYAEIIAVSLIILPIIETALVVWSFVITCKTICCSVHTCESTVPITYIPMQGLLPMSDNCQNQMLECSQTILDPTTTYCVFEPSSVANMKYVDDVTCAGHCTPRSIHNTRHDHVQVMFPLAPPSYQEVNVVKPVKREEDDPRWMGGHNPP